MTPYEITLLFDCYCSSAAPRAKQTPLLDETLSRFVTEGLLKDFVHRETTERAKIYLDALCEMPLPVHKWIMPLSARPCGHRWHPQSVNGRHYCDWCAAVVSDETYRNIQSAQRT